MDAKELINYKKLSLLLTGNDNSIRKNKCPKKYKMKVEEFEKFIEFFFKSNSN